VVTEIVDASADLAIAPRDLWDRLTDPQTYARILPGIGACDLLDTLDGTPMWRMRIGGEDTEIRVLDIQVIVRPEADTIELRCAQTRSFAGIRVHGRTDHTHVAITCVAPDRVHPLVPDLSNSMVTDWIHAGLHRLVDLALGAETSVVTNGDESSVRTQADVARRIMSTGVLRSLRPDRMVKQVGGLITFGFTLAGGYAAGNGHSPHRPAIIDGRGSSTYGEVHARTQALASALADLGIGEGDTVGVLARNHTEMIEITTAAGKLGTDCILLTTGLSAERIAHLAEMHRMAAVFADPELQGRIAHLPPEVHRFTTVEDRDRRDGTSVEDLIASASGRFDKPEHPGRLIVLTSGTTGPAKVTVRPHPTGFSAIAALLSRLPFEMQEIMLIPAPLSHSWGLGALHLSLSTRSTVVLLERFDAQECLRLIAEHQVRTLIALPIMLQRILDLPDSVRERYDTSSLEAVICGGATLPAATVLHFTEIFGEILYNLYGSTETSWITVAEPSDLRISPATVGRPPLGAKIAVLGDDSRPVPVGATGRIFVGHNMLFDGYTEDPPPDEVDGMMDTGDLGYVDAAGRLFIAGRSQERVVSDGRTVFPRPVEEALAALPQVGEVAVVGVPDRELGQRLAAFLVAHEGFGMDPDMIRVYIRQRLGRLAVPRDIIFLDALPRNAAGNVLKRALVRA
jgi:acyl-CoA synthetase (AMP-forming)/AMP-acid ligase II